VEETRSGQAGFVGIYILELIPRGKSDWICWARETSNSRGAQMIGAADDRKGGQIGRFDTRRGEQRRILRDLKVKEQLFAEGRSSQAL